MDRRWRGTSRTACPGHHHIHTAAADPSGKTISEGKQCLLLWRSTISSDRIQNGLLLHNMYYECMVTECCTCSLTRQHRKRRGSRQRVKGCVSIMIHFPVPSATLLYIHLHLIFRLRMPTNHFTVPPKHELLIATTLTSRDDGTDRKYHTCKETSSAETIQYHIQAPCQHQLHI